jgi:hypothetical protein
MSDERQEVAHYSSLITVFGTVSNRNIPADTLMPLIQMGSILLGLLPINRVKSNPDCRGTAIVSETVNSNPKENNDASERRYDHRSSLLHSRNVVN